MSDQTASDLGLALMRLEDVKRRLYKDDPLYDSTVKAMKDINEALSAIAKKASAS